VESDSFEHRKQIKYIEADYHYICQQVQSKLIQTNYVYIYDQLVDMFIKALPFT
jgi:flagellar biosynthesis chaperone FliJ